MNRKILWAAPALLLILLIAPISGFAQLTETEVSESLICYVCPGEPLNVGRCSGGDQMRASITQMLNEGKDKQEILDFFVAQFGEKILTTVPKKGFNLVAYTGPFIALLIGIPAALFIIRRWGSAGRKQAADNGAAKPVTALDEKTRLQIEKELSELDEEN